MQTTLERAEPALRHRFDVDDYYRMAEAGILSPEDRVELIEGEIVDMAPIGSAHGGTVVSLTELVARLVADGKVLVSVQGSLRLDRHNEPQPDLMLLRPRADRYRDSHPTAADVLLLVEVADSSLAYDRGPKLALYARHGVAGGVDRRPRRSGGRGMRAARAGGLCRAPPIYRRSDFASIGFKADYRPRATLAVSGSITKVVRFAHE